MIVGLLQSVWHFVFGWPSVAIVVGIICVVIAALEPPIVAAVIPDLRKWAIAVAVVAFSLTAIAGKYYHDGLAEKQQQLDASLAREAANGEAAHNDAVRSVRAAAPSSVRNDAWNRDNWKSAVGK